VVGMATAKLDLEGAVTKLELAELASTALAELDLEKGKQSRIKVGSVSSRFAISAQVREPHTPQFAPGKSSTCIFVTYLLLLLVSKIGGENSLRLVRGRNEATASGNTSRKRFTSASVLKRPSVTRSEPRAWIGSSPIASNTPDGCPA
jgi:hypothetical protein